MRSSRNIITFSTQSVNILIVCANTIHFARMASFANITIEINSPQHKPVDFNTLPLA